MTTKIWYCKIGEIDEAEWAKISEYWQGADLPMRQAIEKAYERVTGRKPEFTFSGWAAELTENERAVVENRLPR